MSGNMAQNFGRVDYLMALPITLLTLFALGILMLDLMLPAQWKRINAMTALVGILFSAAGVVKIQLALNTAGVAGESSFLNSMVVDRFTIYFWYLFLAGAAISILMSVRYLEIEHENHGEFYALILFSVIGMMCMAAGFDVVLIFIGLELMAISTYVLVGFLRTDRRSNEAALKYLLLGAFSSGIFAYGLSLFYGLTGSTSLLGIRSGLVRLAASHPNHVDPDCHRRLADCFSWPVLQDCGDPVSPMAARCLRRRAHQRHRIHVGRGEGSGLGHAAAHLLVGTVSPAHDLFAAADLRFDSDHDRCESGGADPEQSETPAGLFVYRPRRLYAAGFGGAGVSQLSGAGVLRWTEGHSAVSAGLHLHESGSLRRNRVAAPAQRNWR